jgi:nicotinamidase-related amidase
VDIAEPCLLAEGEITDRWTRPDLSTAALLTIDVQRDVLEGGPLAFASPAAVLGNMVRVVKAFRDAHAPIVHVVRLYLPDGSNADLCRRTAIERGSGALLCDTDGAEIVRDLLPDAGVTLETDELLAGGLQQLGATEVVMYKPRWGAFYHTPLERHLDACGVSTVVVIGCNYPNCPRTTIYQASERDFQVVAVADAISRFDQRARSELADVAVSTWPADRIAHDLLRTAQPDTDVIRPQRRSDEHRR